MYSESYEIPGATGHSEVIEGLRGLKNSTTAHESNQWTASGRIKRTTTTKNNTKPTNKKPSLLSHPNIEVQILNIWGWITELVSTEAWYFLSRNKHPFHHSGHLNFKGSLASGKLMCHRPQRILYKRNRLYCFSLFFQARTILILPEPSQAANKHRLFVWRLSAHHTRKRGKW